MIIDGNSKVGKVKTYVSPREMRLEKENAEKDRLIQELQELKDELEGQIKQLEKRNAELKAKLERSISKHDHEIIVKQALSMGDNSKIGLEEIAPQTFYTMKARIESRDKLIQELKDELRKERKFADYIVEPDKISEDDMDGLIPKWKWLMRWRQSVIERARQRIKERKEFK